MRSLKEVANSTPPDYLAHIPKNPEYVAEEMLFKARQLFPKRLDESGDMGKVFEPDYSFLFVGPGAGLVVNALLQRGQVASGLETSKRGIASAPQGVWAYIRWAVPWELPFPTMRGEPPRPFKNFDVTYVNGYLKTILEPDEWDLSLSELEKISKHISIIETKGN